MVGVPVLLLEYVVDAAEAVAVTVVAEVTVVGTVML